jgi:hypothetical protein
MLGRMIGLVNGNTKSMSVPGAQVMFLGRFWTQPCYIS